MPKFLIHIAPEKEAFFLELLAQLSGIEAVQRVEEISPSPAEEAATRLPKTEEETPWEELPLTERYLMPEPLIKPRDFSQEPLTEEEIALKQKLPPLKIAPMTPEEDALWQQMLEEDDR
jgi:hypothetical protein